MLEIKSVSKNFTGVQALKNVSFTVKQGEVHALVGENGAGKSTLMKILSGVHSHYDGEILVDGEHLTFHNPREAQDHGIAIIHQELNLVPELTISENIFLGRELKTPLLSLDKKRMAAETTALLDQLNLHLPPQRPIRELRVGERQLVEVAKALSLEARLLILDEPTSALSETEIQHLFEVIAKLKAQGVTMIYISHKLDEIFEISDQVTVLRDGGYVNTVIAEETTERELIQMMVGRNLQELFPKEVVDPGEAVLQAEALGLRSSKRQGGYTLKDISFSLRRGEILGIAGLMGAGRTELLETLFGVHPRSQIEGEIIVGGQEWQFGSPQQALQAGLAFVTEDRKNQSLIIQHSVGHNITLAALNRFTTGGFIRDSLERQAIQDSTKTLQIKVVNSDVPVDTLSGGNQQKVALAKCLLTQPDVLLLDEPTRGIDVGAKAEIYTLISKLAQDGAGVIMASSELPEILAMCDRIIVLCEGRITAIYDQAQASQELIMQAATTIQRAETNSNIH